MNVDIQSCTDSNEWWVEQFKIAESTVIRQREAREALERGWFTSYADIVRNYMLVGDRIPTLDSDNKEWWPLRFEIVDYILKCEIAGFCNTDNTRYLCAALYVAGKRAVTPPGTRRRKAQAKRTRELLKNLPSGLLEALEEGKKTKAWAQYVGGNEKAVNAVIGPLIKRFGVTFEVVSTLIKQTEEHTK